MKRALFGFVVAGVVAAAATQSQAVTITYKGLGLSDSVQYKVNGNSSSGKVGQLLINFENKNYKAYCVDIDHAIKSSWSADKEPLTVINGGKAMAYLYDKFAAGVNTGVKAAALQVAIWEVLKDWGGSLNLSSGNFQLTSSSSVKSQAQQYLASLPSNLNNYTSKAYILESNNNPRSQHLIVPEPGTLAAVILTLPLIIARRHRARA